MDGRIFVCHASADAGSAQRAASALERAGIGCWIAPRDIAPGENYTQAILEALAAAPALVLVFSAAANESPHVQRELETAVGTGTRIIPLRLEPVPPSPSLRYFIGSAQWLDIAELSPAQWEPLLVESARRALGPPPTTTSSVAVATSVPPPRGRSRRVMIATPAAVLLVAVVAAAAWVFARGDDGSDTTRASSTSSSKPAGPSTPASTVPSQSPSPSPSQSPSQPSSPEPSPVTGTAVVEDGFEGSTAFPIGTYREHTGTMVSSLRSGRLRVSVRHISDGWDSWVSVDTPTPLTDWTVRSSFVSARSNGACGLMVSDGLTVVTADLNRGSASARISIYGTQKVLAQRSFTAPSVTGPLALSLEGGLLVMRAGDVVVASLPSQQLGPITQGGLVGVGDTNDCDFDDFAMLHRP